MRGGMGYQITQVFNNSGIFTPSESKHEAKREARLEGAQTWCDIGKSINIYAFSTAETYKDVWHQLGDHVRAEGLKDITKITPEHIASYLSDRIEQGIAFPTYQKEASAIQKFETALNRFSYSEKYNFQEAIRGAAREAQASLTKNEISRSYSAPAILTAAVQNIDHKIAAKLQHEGGARINEISLVKADQLKGNGKIEVHGKGGKIRDISVSKETYAAVSARIAEKGEFRIDKEKYYSSLKAACAATSQAYQGSHGLRWSYAQESHLRHMENGKTYEQALSTVSHEMGHERSDITLHYLR